MPPADRRNRAHVAKWVAASGVVVAVNAVNAENAVAAEVAEAWAI